MMSNRDRTGYNMGIGWNSKRRVVAARQEYPGVTFNENFSFTYTGKGWITRHNALCSWLAVRD
jgi:hypothetical protein